MEYKSATKIDAILEIDLDELEDVVGGKKKKSTKQTANVTQNADINFDFSGAGSVSSFFCAGSGSSINISINQDSDVHQEAD